MSSLPEPAMDGQRPSAQEEGDPKGDGTKAGEKGPEAKRSVSSVSTTFSSFSAPRPSGQDGYPAATGTNPGDAELDAQRSVAASLWSIWDGIRPSAQEEGEGGLTESQLREQAHQASLATLKAARPLKVKFSEPSVADKDGGGPVGAGADPGGQKDSAVSRQTAPLAVGAETLQAGGALSSSSSPAPSAAEDASQVAGSKQALATQPAAESVAPSAEQPLAPSSPHGPSRSSVSRRLQSAFGLQASVEEQAPGATPSPALSAPPAASSQEAPEAPQGVEATEAARTPSQGRGEAAKAPRELPGPDAAARGWLSTSGGRGDAARRGDSAPALLERGRVQAHQRRTTRLSVHVRRSMFSGKRATAAAGMPSPEEIAAAAERYVAAQEEKSKASAAGAGKRGSRATWHGAAGRRSSLRKPAAKARVQAAAAPEAGAPAAEGEAAAVKGEAAAAEQAEASLPAVQGEAAATAQEQAAASQGEPAAAKGEAVAAVEEAAAAEAAGLAGSAVAQAGEEAGEEDADRFGEEDSAEESEEDEEDEEDDGSEMRGEEWPEFLMRMQLAIQAAGIENEPAVLFEAFRTTENISLIFATFARLFHLATAPVSEGGRRQSVSCRVAPPWRTEDEGHKYSYPYEPIRLLLGGNFKAKRIWTLLDERAARPEYAEAAGGDGRLRGRRCVVVGAGPCGLRAAVELRLLGANVTVIDQRRSFSRINQLHIWSWAGEDLKGLGAKLIEPPGSGFGSNPDLMHITINELQKFLLKIALLLGVEVLLGVHYDGVKHVNGEWRAELSVAVSGPGTAEGRAESRTSNPGCLTPASRGPPPSPSARRFIHDVAVLVGAGGFSSDLGEQLGMPMQEMGSLRRESAIGLICNLARTNSKGEGKLRSYSMARQFYGAHFKTVEKDTGAELENVVYVKSHLSHYFVMTPTAKCLTACGVVKDRSHQPMLDMSNLDQEKLDELVQKLASFPFKKDEPPVLAAMTSDSKDGSFPGYADGGPRLFDFSKMRRSQEGLRAVPPPGVDPEASGVEDDSLLAVLVGDCLVEPFWPEGLGIIRGFFSALDACSAIKLWAEGANRVKTAAHLDASFSKLKTLSASTRARVLQENEKKYGLLPESRYRL